MKRLLTIILFFVLLAPAACLAQGPEFTYASPRQVIYWTPPTGFGQVAKSWTPPPEFEWTAEPWTPPKGFQGPTTPWAPPTGWGAVEEWGAPQEFR